MAQINIPPQPQHVTASALKSYIDKSTAPNYYLSNIIQTMEEKGKPFTEDCDHGQVVESTMHFTEFMMREHYDEFLEWMKQKQIKKALKEDQ